MPRSVFLDPWTWVPAPPSDPLAARSPEVISAELERLAFFVERYHDSTVVGLDRVPDGPALIVGNHNGGIMAPDMFALMVAWWRARGIDEPAYGLMHDIVFRVPGAGRYLARLGAVPASPKNATELLRRGAKVLVYPGGDIDAFKPHARRHEIVFGKRHGFIRIALREQVPIVPAVSVGAHDSLHILTDGADLMRRTGLKRLTRVEVLPVSLGLPWIIWVGPMGYLPLPVRMKVELLDPISWPDLGPEAASDDAVVHRCREEVREKMQTTLDEMVKAGGWGRRRIFGA